MKSHNFKLALFYDNIVWNLIWIFQNINTSVGSRAFSRLLLGGNLATEYYVNFMDFLHEKGVPSSITDSCKKLLTRNRTDLEI